MYCRKCGAQINDTDRFCPSCGSPQTEIDQKNNKTIEGKIHKCPSCGEILKAYDMICPSCGHELRDVETNKNLNEFVNKYSSLDSDDKKIELIKNYVIPNTKEDILEFMSYGNSQINWDFDIDELENAWIEKCIDIYNKSTIIFKNEKDMKDIKQMYEFIVQKYYNVLDHHNSLRKKHKNKIKFKFIGIASLVIFGIIVIICLTIFVRKKYSKYKYEKNIHEITTLNSSNINKNTGYDNDYRISSEKEYITIYELKIADIKNYLLAVTDYSTAYDVKKNLFKFDYNSIKEKEIADNINSLMSKNEMNAVKSDSYDSYLNSFIYKIKSNAADKINEKYKADENKEFDVVMTCNMNFYVYEEYDQFKDEKKYYYNFSYDSLSYHFVENASEISIDKINFNEITSKYNKKEKLTTYNVVYNDATQYKITDAGFGKNVSQYIKINDYSKYKFDLIRQYEYSNLKINVKFSITEKYHGDQEIRICNSDNYENYLFTLKKEFATALKTKETYEVEYSGNIDDISNGEFYVFFDASGKDDDDWYIEDLVVTTSFTR